jgi:excisionase family DNA binding protein
MKPEVINQNLPDVLTAPEIAKFLKIGRVKAYELMKTGEIASFRVGKRNVRTTKQALLNYIRKGSEKVG